MMLSAKLITLITSYTIYSKFWELVWGLFVNKKTIIESDNFHRKIEESLSPDRLGIPHFISTKTLLVYFTLLVSREWPKAKKRIYKNRFLKNVSNFVSVCVCESDMIKDGEWLAISLPALSHCQGHTELYRELFPFWFFLLERWS